MIKKTSTQYFSFFIFIFSNFIYLQAQDFEIRNFHVDIDISKEGYFTVREDIEIFFFEERRGIFRSIPFVYELEGERTKIGLEDIQVADHPFKVSRKGNNVEIRIGDPKVYINGSQKYTIQYKAVGAFLYGDDHIEFYWNMTGNHWPVHIEFVSYRINMPDHVIIHDEDIVFYAGKKGEARQDGSLSKTGRYIQGKMNVGLTPGEGITVAVKLPKDYIDKPVTINEPKSGGSNRYRLQNDTFSLIPATLLTLLILAFRRYGYNKKKTEPVETQYYPPKGMPAAEVGTFYDYVANNRDVISLIPQWGYQGFVEVNSIPGPQGEQDIYFIRKRELPAGTPEYEKILWDGLFENKSQVFLSELSQKFYTVMASTKSSLYKEVAEPRLYDRESMAYFRSNWNFALFFGFIAGGIMLMIAFGWILSGIITVIMGITLLIFRVMPPKFSREGRDLHRQMEGLKKFLEDPPAEELARIIEKDPGYLDFIYPYVVAFGIDKAWTETLSRPEMNAFAPAWFILMDSSGNRIPSQYTHFSKEFNVQKVNYAFSTTPSTSGISGSSSRSSTGSSGGGFGGGGGGSW